MVAINIRLDLYRRAIKLDIDIVTVANDALEQVIVEKENQNQ